MRYDKKASIYVSTSTPNGYGGFIKDIQLFAEVEACITPLHYDLVAEGSVIKTMTTCKLFTKVTLPKVIDHVIVDGMEFNVLNHADLGKIQMLQLEKMGNG